jgi:hypothetical protein
MDKAAEEERPRYGTQFLETEAILAAGADGDEEYLDRLLARMSDREVEALRNAANTLRWKTKRRLGLL